MSTPVEFTVLGHNVQGTDPQRQILATIDHDLKQGASVVLLSELVPGLPIDVPEKWGMARVKELGIIWDGTVWENKHHGYIPTHKGQRGVTPDRGIFWVLVKHRTTGRHVCFMSTHAVHHVEANGQPIRYRGRERVKYRYQQWRLGKHLRTLAWAIGQWRAGKVTDVVWHGDLNVDYGAELRLAATRRCRWFPMTRLGAVTRFVMPAKATNGARRIDWTGISGDLRAVSCEALPGLYSDHRAVKSVLAFTERVR